jgi:DNA-binding NtrC family response regulator
MERLLFIDLSDKDDSSIIEEFEKLDYQVAWQTSLDTAISHLSTSRPDAVLLKHKLKADKAVELVGRVKKNVSGLFILVGDESDESIIEQYFEHGIDAYFREPFSIQNVNHFIKKLIRQRTLNRKLENFRSVQECRNHYEGLIGGSAPMRALYSLIDSVGESDISVLVEGEKGCELLATAKALASRDASVQLGGEVVVANLHDVPAGEIENSLFHRRNDDTSGYSLIEKADGGVLIVHGINLLPPEVQAKLNAVLLERQVRDEKTGRVRSADFRLISTTPHFLMEEMRQGNFLRDLFFKINTATLQVPPLRERREDIPLLADYFLRKANKRLKTQVSSLSYRVHVGLLNYDWPENVDELRSAIYEAVESAQTGEISEEHLPLEIFHKARENSQEASRIQIAFKKARTQFELEYFTQLLRDTKGNMTKASSISNVGRPYLYKKLQEYSLKPSDFRGDKDKE